jgi:hypothetical protein
MIQDNNPTKGLDNRQRGDGLRLLLGRRRQRWPEDSQKARPEIASSDHVQLSRVRQLRVHVSVRQQVLPLEPEIGRYLGDCHGDEWGGHCKEDSQSGA